MPLAAPSTKPISRLRKPARPAPEASGSQHAVEEIHAYIAVRDSLLREAEGALSEAALQRLVLANNFVANCLRPVRGPYFAQSLPESDAARELKRCAGVDASIAQLRARLTAAA